jgi:Tol biopolymer transport system component
MQLVALAAAIWLSACASGEPFSASPAARTSSPRSAPATQPIVTPTADASPSAVDPLAALLDPHVGTWVPVGPTLLVTVARAREGVIVAVPLDGAPATTLLTVHDLSGSSPATVAAVARSDGSLLALALGTSFTTRRIAFFDLARGQARWLTTPGAGESAGLPVWAADGSSLYFGTADPSAVPGISHVTLDGATLQAIHPTVSFGSLLSVSRVTTDGVLIGADEFNGPTVWALDLATGQKVSFGEHNSVLWAWRPTRPRGLVSAFSNIAAPGAGSLNLWDGVTGAKTVILPEPVAGADFDPTGTRIVAAITDRADQQIRLNIMNADGSGRRVLAGTDNARSPIWTESGIAYDTYVPEGLNEVRIVSPSGGGSRTLYATTGTIQRMQLIAPRH